jgi:hypothetical protein
MLVVFLHATRRLQSSKTNHGRWKLHVAVTGSMGHGGPVLATRLVGEWLTACRLRWTEATVVVGATAGSTERKEDSRRWRSRRVRQVKRGGPTIRDAMMGRMV